MPCVSFAGPLFCPELATARSGSAVAGPLACAHDAMVDAIPGTRTETSIEDEPCDPPSNQWTPLLSSCEGMEVSDAEDETEVFARVQARGGGPAGEQWPTADAGGDRGGHLAIDAAELASDGSRRAPAARGPRRRPASPLPSPAEQAAEITRLKRELDRTRHGARRAKKSDRHLRGGAEMSFNFIQRPCRTAWPVRLMCRVLERLAQRLLRLAQPSRERSGARQPRAARRRPSPPCRAPWPLRQPPDARRASRRRQDGKPWPCRAADAAPWHPRVAGRRFSPCTTDSRHYLPIAPEPAEQDVRRRGAEPRLARRHHLHRDRRRLACTSPPCSTWRPARSSAGRCATICAPSCRWPP